MCDYGPLEDFDADFVFKVRGDRGGVGSLNFDLRVLCFHCIGDGGGLRTLNSLVTGVGVALDLVFDLDLDLDF